MSKKTSPSNVSWLFSFCLTCLMLLSSMSSAHSDQIVILEDVVRGVLGYNLETKKQQTYVEQSDAAAQQISSVFDWSLIAEGGYRRPRVPGTNNDNLLTAETETNNVYSVRLGVGKQFRNGITVRPGISYSKNTNGNASDVLAESVSLGHLAVNIPLLRGRGTQATTANERASQKNVEASKLNKDRRLAETLVHANAQYWQSVAAKRNLEAKQRAGEEAVAISETLRKLSEQGEVSVLEYQNSVANLNLRRLKIEKSAVTWNSTRRKLARLIQKEHRIDNLPISESQFPNFDPKTSLNLNENALVDLAFEQRRDLLALHRRVQSRHIGLFKARNDMWPQLDLNLDLDKVYVNYTQSLGNNLGKGRKRDAAAKLRAHEIEIQMLKRAISDEVYEAIEDLKYSLKSYRHAYEAHQLLTQIASTTRNNVSQGTAGRTEYLTALDKLSDVEHIMNEASVNYINALAKLRLATGTLALRNDSIKNTLNTLLSVPSNG